MFRAKAKPYIASMGIYAIRADVLKQLLLDIFPSANDFGNEIIPGAKDAGLRVCAYAFDGYWADLGTIESYYEASMAIARLRNFRYEVGGLPFIQISPKVINLNVRQSFFDCFYLLHIGIFRCS